MFSCSQTGLFTQRNMKGELASLHKGTCKGKWPFYTKKQGNWLFYTKDHERGTGFFYTMEHARGTGFLTQRNMKGELAFFSSTQTIKGELAFLHK